MVVRARASEERSVMARRFLVGIRRNSIQLYKNFKIWLPFYCAFSHCKSRAADVMIDSLGEDGAILLFSTKKGTQ